MSTLQSTLISLIKFSLAGTMLIGMSVIGLTGCDKKDAQATQAKNAQLQMPPPTVNVMTVQMQQVPLIKTFSGRTVASRTADVRPQTTGIIEEVMYREGSMVKQGQPLYRINADDYEFTATSSQAALGQAQAGVQTAKASYDSARANLASQEALLEQARTDVQRLEPLVKMNAISKQQFDQAITKFKTAQAAVQNAKAAVNQAAANIASSKAGVAVAQAQLQTSTNSLSRTIVTAPIEGITNISKVTVGTLVNANQADPLVSITQINPIYVDIQQSSADLLKLKKQTASGQIGTGSNSVELVLEDGTTYPAQGQLSLIEASVNENTGSTTLRARFPNDNYLLMPGMFVTAKLLQGVINQAVLLPQSALIRTPSGDTQVYVIDNQNEIAVKKVTVNGTHQGNWIVTQGLQSGEKVVVQGGSKVYPKQKVTVQPYAEQTTISHAKGTLESLPTQRTAQQANIDASFSQLDHQTDHKIKLQSHNSQASSYLAKTNSNAQ